MEKTSEQWITEIDFSVQQLKLNNRHTYYGFSLDMTRETANAIKVYFEKENFQVEITMCPRKQWDIVIQW